MSSPEEKTLMIRYLEEIREAQKAADEEHKSLRTAFEKTDKKLDLHIQKTEYELQAIRELDRIQNEQLEEHIQGVKQAHRRNDLLEKTLRAEIFGEGSPNPEKSLKGRVEALEAPRKWFKDSKKMLLGAGTVAAAIYGIVKLIQELSTLL